MSAEHNTAPLLTLEEISKRFGSTQALTDVSVGIHPGCIHALIGENGAGKSTLVKIISGVLPADHGIIQLDGRPVTFDGPAAAAAAGIHLVHQELALLPHRSVTANIFLGQEERGRAGLDWATMAQRSREALSRLGLELDVEQRVGELSTANQQMVEIARALVHRSRLIILDEPTAALSPADTDRLFAVLEQLANEGAAVLYISHRLDEIERIAHDVTVLKDGEHVITQPAEGLTTEHMVALMVGHEIQDLFPPAHTTEHHARPVVEIEGLVDPPAVVAASLTLNEGEIVGLYGLEGHGQDEILTCIAGARHPVRGTLRVHGQPRSWGSVPAMINAGVGFVPEDRKTEGLILNMSGTRNITLPVLRDLSRAGVVDTGREVTRARDAADAAAVRGDLGAAVGSLSGGNQQKLVLARWIAARSSILLLNQPTRGVDVGSKAEIYKLIRDICTDNGTAALVVSREILELQGMCDRILVMSHGRLVAEHPPTASEETILGSAVRSRTA